MTILAGVFPSSFIHPFSHVRHHIKHHHVSNITIKEFQEILPALHGSIKYWLSLRGSVYAKVWLRRSSMVKCELWDLLSLFSCRILRPSTRNAVVVRHNRITQHSLRFPMIFSIICREQFTTEKKIKLSSVHCEFIYRMPRRASVDDKKKMSTTLRFTLTSLLSRLDEFHFTFFFNQSHTICRLAAVDDEN